MISAQEILAAVSAGESKDWEFKSARGGLPRSTWETYSAMANTDGGVIVLGVEDREGVLTVSGLDNPTRIQRDFWNNVNNRGVVNINLLTDQDVTLDRIGERSVLTVRVPRASRRQRPVFVGQNPLLGTYRRNSDGDYHCTPEEVGRMLADQSEEPADSRILEGFGLDDLDAASIQQYRQRFSARAPDHAWLALETKELLEKLGPVVRAVAPDALPVAGAGAGERACRADRSRSFARIPARRKRLLRCDRAPGGSARDVRDGARAGAPRGARPGEPGGLSKPHDAGPVPSPALREHAAREQPRRFLRGGARILRWEAGGSSAAAVSRA